MLHYVFKWILLSIYKIIVLIYRYISNRKEKQKNIGRNFDLMDGHEFEFFCRDLLEDNGFKNVEVTKGSGDQGIDIIANNGNKKVGFQCKNYAGKVGNNAVQEAYAGQSFYGLEEVYVLTNNYFTDSAKQLALSTGVILLDRGYILSKPRNKPNTLIFKPLKSINKKNNFDSEVKLQQELEDMIESYYVTYNTFVKELDVVVKENLTGLSELYVETDLMDNVISLVEPLIKKNNEAYVDLLCIQVVTISYAFKTLNLATLDNNIDIVFESLNDLSEIFKSYYE